jgi:hypothetical protein
MKPMMRKLSALLLPAAVLLSLAGPAGARATKKRSAARSAPPAAATEAAAPPPPARSTDDAPAETRTTTVAAGGDSLPDAPPAPPPKPAAAPRAASDGAKAGGGESPPPAPASSSPGGAPDLEKLRADYDRLRDDLFRSRARAQIVEDGLYKSKLSAAFRWKGAPGALVHHATLRLDGGEIWDSGDKPVTDDLITVAERGVKPGPHALTLHLEIRPGKKSKDSDKLGYSSEHTFAIMVPDGLRTHVAITGDEDGSLPEYEPQIEVELESQK